MRRCSTQIWNTEHSLTFLFAITFETLFVSILKVLTICIWNYKTVIRYCAKVSWQSRLKTRLSRLEARTNWVLRHANQVSRRKNWVLSFEKPAIWICITPEDSKKMIYFSTKIIAILIYAKAKIHADHRPLTCTLAMCKFFCDKKGPINRINGCLSWISDNWVSVVLQYYEL